MSDPATAAPATFEASLLRLDEIARILEDNRLGLNESLAVYEEGVKLLKECQKILQSAERKIELLTGVDAAGNAITVPFADEATFQPNRASNEPLPDTSPAQTIPAQATVAQSNASSAPIVDPAPIPAKKPRTKPNPVVSSTVYQSPQAAPPAKSASLTPWEDDPNQPESMDEKGRLF